MARRTLGLVDRLTRLHRRRILIRNSLSLTRPVVCHKGHTRHYRECYQRKPYYFLIHILVLNSFIYFEIFARSHERSQDEAKIDEKADTCTDAGVRATQDA